MKAIRYSLHFASLALAAVIFWLAQDLSLPYWISSFNFFPFALMGALHATCIVVSLRDRRATHSITFITLTAIWSALTPIAGMWGSIVWFPFDDFLRRYGLGDYMIFLTGSAIGASGYWLLVRQFWLKSLRWVDWLRTVSLCVTATLLSVLLLDMLDRYVHGVAKLKADIPILTVAWWFAFSISLYWSESNITLRKRDIALGIAAVILVFAGAIPALHQLDERIANDRARLSDLKEIAGALHVDWEYAQDKKLEWHAPSSLKDIPKVLQGARIADPITGVPYDYLPESGSKYQLCAIFDHDSTRQDPLLTDKGWSFPKGRQCFAVDASTSPY